MSSIIIKTVEKYSMKMTGRKEGRKEDTEIIIGRINKRDGKGIKVNEARR
jgi:hypothetical protein